MSADLIPGAEHHLYVVLTHWSALTGPRLVAVPEGGAA